MKPGPGAGLRWSSTVETIVFLAAVLVVNYLLHPDDRAYLAIDPHPFWAIIILISIRYSFRESILAAVIAAGTFSYFVLFPAAGAFHFSAISLYSDFKEPLLFLIVAGVISGYTQHLTERTNVLRRLLGEKDVETTALRDANRASSEALRQLEARIAGESTSVLNLFEELARTKRLDSDGIKKDLIEVLERYVHAEVVTYYEVDRGNLQQSFTSRKGQDPGGTNLSEDILLAEALRSEQVAHLGQFLTESDLEGYRGLSLLAGALRDVDGEALGVVSVERLPFVDYNPYTFKMFETTIQWWGSILDERLRLEELREQSVFSEQLRLYNYNYFRGRIAQEFERARRFSLPLSLGLLRIDRYGEVQPDRRDDLKATIARLINGAITELDMAALYRCDDVLALSFPIAMAQDAQDRLEHIAREIEAFDFHPYDKVDEPLSVRWCVAEYEIGMASHEELIRRAEEQIGLASDG